MLVISEGKCWWSHRFGGKDGRGRAGVRRQQARAEREQVPESVVSVRVTARPVLTGGKGGGGRRPGDSAGGDPGEREPRGAGGRGCQRRREAAGLVRALGSGKPRGEGMNLWDSGGRGLAAAQGEGGAPRG